MTSSTLSGESSGKFKFTMEDFRYIAGVIADHAGIALSDVKKDLVYGRLARRLRALKLTTFSDYCDLLSSGHSDEMEYFVNALTTNLTSFFREGHHFEYLQNDLIPQLVKQKNSRTLRVWSAGCSTGEEPYSLAIVLSEAVPLSWDVRILATDLDSNVIATAKRGVYNDDRLDGLSPARLQRWFRHGVGKNAGMAKVNNELRDMVTFKELNLFADWPLKGEFDIIFCRNVVIYFSKETQTTLFDRFAEQMKADGHLFIGHSETLFKVSDRFTPTGKTIYQRTS